MASRTQPDGAMCQAASRHDSPAGGRRRSLRVLFLVAHPEIRGPLPKIGPLLTAGLTQAGAHVETEYWSRRDDHESLAEKVTGRLTDLLAIRRHLRTCAVDVVLVTTTHDEAALTRDLPLTAMLDRLNVPVVLQFHGSKVDELDSKARPRFTAATARLVERAAAILVLSSEEKEKWRAFAPHTPVEVVLNPFVAEEMEATAHRPDERTSEPEDRRDDGTPEPGRQPGVPELLFVGRLIEAKGIYDLIEALAVVRRTRPARLLVAGAGDLLAVRAAALRHGVPDDVEVLGYRQGEELDRLYERASALVLPTYFGEGFPTVITEALSHGLPVITTPIRGAADLLTDGEDALFVPPRRPEALAAAIERVLADGALRRRLAQGGRRTLELFHPERVAPRYLDVLAAVAARRRLASLPAPERQTMPAFEADGDGVPAADTALSAHVLGLRIDPVALQEAGELILRWAHDGSPRMVAAANVHMVMEARDDPALADVLESADLVVADGRPVFLAARRQGAPSASHVRGQDLMLHVCHLAAFHGVPVALVGGRLGTLELLGEQLMRMFPGLRLVLSISPSFGGVEEWEDEATTAALVASGARIVFVGLGCPRQEHWMAAHRGRLAAVQIGVGAAFDMIAGTHVTAPAWARKTSLEWAFRLGSDPRRLWKRYMQTNTRYVMLTGRKAMQRKRRRAA